MRDLLIALVVVACVAHVASASPKRDLPDYDGRGNPDVHRGSWALWIPRILLSPLYVVNEFVLRRPLGWIITKAEQGRWIDAATDVFTFGPEHNYLLVPTALFDFGLLPSVGLYFSGDNAFTPGNSIELYAATGGPRYLTALALDRYSWNDGRTALSGRLGVERQLDHLFLGIGPDVTSATESRYGLETLDARAIFRQTFLGESWFNAYAGIHRIAYRRGDCCGNPSVEDRVADGSLPAPPGLGLDYTSAYQRVDAVVDSRPQRPAPGTGVYAGVHGETTFDIRNDRSWIKYGGVVGGALDLTGHQRTLRLLAAVEMVDPIEGEIPFNQLSSLGSDLMPGFVPGWMLGRSTFATQLAYTWPVAAWVDGVARLSAGNAFDEHLGGLAVGKMRLSGDVGLTTIDARDQGFEVIFGLGTETIEQGEHITSVRFAFGTRRGF